MKTKEIKTEKFSDPIERAGMSYSNGTKLITHWFNYDDQQRFLVLDKEKKNERVILEISQRNNSGVHLFGITSSGQYAFGATVNKNSSPTIDGRRISSYWKGLGIVTLN